ncbi:MAG: hypothetical protein QOG09_1371, partial [Solirubrobacterales bacterium]|nr:hypothetical protein [Solirubrobacterales bacterium]
MGRTGERARIGAIALLVVGTAILGTTVARADDPVPSPGDPAAQVPSDPGKTCADQTAAANPGALGCDNVYTPIAKDGAGLGWTQVAGAVFPDAPHPGYDPAQTASKVPVTVNFYSVSFVNQHNGLAAGAQCKDDPPEGASGVDLDQFLAGCVRVPVIYRYTDNTELGPVWKEAYRSDRPGYVGAISWLRNADTNDHGQRALAVGGEGRYVDREAAFPDEVAKACEQGAVKAPEVDPGGRPPSARQPLNFGDPVDQGTIVKAHDPRAELADCEDRWRQANDPAGKGRAWLLSDGSWDEQDTPATMRGMQALDASLRPDDCPGGTNECAFAGALQQIWIWKNGSFDPLPWRGDLGPDRPSRPLIAGTGTTRCTTAAACDWHFRVRGIRFKPTIDSSIRGAVGVTAGCCSALTHPDVVRDGGRVLNFDPGGGTVAVLAFAPSGQNVTIPDSLFALTFGKASNLGVADGLCGSYLGAPGGPATTGEPPSQIMSRGGVDCPGGGIGDFLPGGETLRTSLSSARLVAGDGDFQTQQPNFTDREAGSVHRAGYPGGDNLMDWAVGGDKGNDRGLAF